MRSQPYKTGLDERLKDPKYAAAYISAAKKESNEVFMLALRDVVEAHKVSRVAAAAKVNRETLYRTLSARGNPTVKTLNSILKVLGIEELYSPRVVKGLQKRVVISARRHTKTNQNVLQGMTVSSTGPQNACYGSVDYFFGGTGSQTESTFPMGYTNQNGVPHGNTTNLPPPESTLSAYLSNKLLDERNYGLRQENVGDNPASIGN